MKNDMKMKNETLEFIVDLMKCVVHGAITAAYALWYLFMPSLVVIGLVALFLHFVLKIV